MTRRLAWWIQRLPCWIWDHKKRVIAVDMHTVRYRCETCSDIWEQKL